MNTAENCGALPFVCALFFVFMVLIYPWYETSTIECQIYKATLPFGVLEYRGKISGGGMLIGFIGIGSIYGELTGEEMYYIKYLKNNELYSVSLDAKRNRIIIDGKFMIEEVYETSHNRFGVTGVLLVGYKIHIPELPLVNNTMTQEWIIR